MCMQGWDSLSMKNGQMPERSKGIDSNEFAIY